MKYRALLRGFGLASVAVLAAACGDAGDPGDIGGEGAPKVEIEALPGAHVVDVGADGIPSFVVGELGSVEVKENPNDVDLRPALEVIAPVFHASPEALVLKKAQSDNIGDQHFRFRQVKNGRDVVGGELVVHVREGVIYAVNGAARDDLDTVAMPKIAAADAAGAALAAANEGQHTPDEEMDVDVQGEAKLAYFLEGGRMDLVYEVELQGIRGDMTPVRDSVLVNAVDGKIVARMPHVYTAKNRKVHNLNHGTALPGAVARTEGQAAIGETDVDTNYDRLGTVYDCYSTLFGRDSYNGAGAQMVSSVHYSNNYVNAYWDGTQMVYGDGNGVDASSLARSMDVTAHELTHAVTENESNLTYSGESGGINEAMSDIFGNTCEWFRDGQVVSANTWIVGEDCWTPSIPNDGLRYMNDPVKDGSSLDYWTSGAGSVDVHYSSGIANLAFYLLSQGGTHPRGKSSVNVTGIGIAKASQIFYRANRDLLTASSNYAALKTATEQAASQLGYTAAEIASVTAAWNAVGVGVPPPPPTALSNNVPVTGIADSSGGNKYYSLVVPAGATNLSFTTSGGTDTAEFVEIYNAGNAAVDLSTYSLQFVNGGNNAVYLNMSLASAGSLAAGQYLVVGNSAVTPAAGALKINFAAGSDKIQNGAPDGVALVDGSTLVDAISYEGSITAAVLSGPGTQSLVEGTALATSTADSNTLVKSLGRFPNGSDTNVSKTDWSLRSVVTPGAANQ